MSHRAAPDESLYETVLGHAFPALHAHVRRAHTPPLHAAGTMDVEHGPGWLSRWIIWLMKLPAAGNDQPVRLDVDAHGPDLLWRRRIGDSSFETRQRARGARLVERSGLADVAFELAADEGALRYRHASIHVAGLRVPSSLSPRISAVVTPSLDGWRVAVSVTWRARLVCRYIGAMHAS